MVVGDFTSNRMLYNWTAVGTRILSFLSGLCLGLKSLTIEFPVEEDIVRSIVASCTNLVKVVVETRGHTIPAGKASDMTSHCCLKGC